MSDSGIGYGEFLKSKQDYGCDSGFEPIWMPDFLYDFQRYLVEWAIRRGRAAIFADCGLGKTPMQLVWAENVIRATRKNVLVITPLAVGHQTLQEAEKFGIDATRSRHGEMPATPQVVITNYEQLDKFFPDDFSGVVCDESSAIKNFDSKRKAVVTEFMRSRPYRLLCTATAAPNDYFELGTSSEALGEMGFRDMITKFFKQETTKDHLGWGRTKYRFRGHAERPFWRWVCSWARACRRPSDFGFSDDKFHLPALQEHEEIVHCKKTRAGLLFSVPAKTLEEQREERRLTLDDRCEHAAEHINGTTSVAWCHLNAEADLMEKLIPDALQVSGSMSDEQKEERLLAFTRGELRVLVTKPKIGCWGLNWQHCQNVTMFPSHSFEQYYQAVRRCWRFGQTKPVDVTLIATEGEAGVLSNLQRKSEQCDRMFTSLVEEMNAELALSTAREFLEQEDVPGWL